MSKVTVSQYEFQVERIHRVRRQYTRTGEYIGMLTGFVKMPNGEHYWVENVPVDIALAENITVGETVFLAVRKDAQ